jgi:hypothetical protein
MKTFTTQVDSCKVNGTTLCGYVETTYDNIVKHLGEPVRTNGSKTNAEWFIEFEDGPVASIYDWKTNVCPKGVYRWHIGGHKMLVVERIATILDSPYIETPF